jgi:hypothetical protein
VISAHCIFRYIIKTTIHGKICMTSLSTLVISALGSTGLELILGFRVDRRYDTYFTMYYSLCIAYCIGVLRGRMVKISVSYHEVSQAHAVWVWILFEKIWMNEKVCQFTCGMLVVSPQIHCIMYLGSPFYMYQWILTKIFNNWTMFEHGENDKQKRAYSKWIWLDTLFVPPCWGVQ